MRRKVTEQGVTVPKQWFQGAAEVEIQREDGRVVVVSLRSGTMLWAWIARN